MQVDPSLLQMGEFGNQQPDLSGIDPALLELSNSMAAARAGQASGSTGSVLEDGQTVEATSLEDQVLDVQEVLADFVSR